MHLEPSGFIGAAMAVQGIKDATVILHGQTGCRKGLLPSQSLMPRTAVRDGRFYGKDNAIPYSNVRPEDYYGDTLEKLMGVMEHVDAEDYSLKVLMCSPGISMVGDDCKRASRSPATLFLDTDSLPSSAIEGFDRCICEIVKFLNPERNSTIVKGINIVGLSIMHKDWSSFRHELSHLLKDAGFTVVSALGAGCTVDDIKNSVNAEYNIVVDPAYGGKTAEYYEKEYGTKTISIGKCPIGFDAVEEFLIKIGEVTGVMPEHGLSMLKKSRRRAYEGVTLASKRLDGMTFDIIAPDTAKQPLRAFLMDSFGMVEDDDSPDYLFAPGNISVLEEASGRCGKGIDIGFPSSSGPAFLKEPLMGMEGVMYILDSLFNRPCRTPLRGASSRGYALS
jgi:hypothetical protein